MTQTPLDETAMAEAIEAHFRLEADDDVDGVLETLTEDVDHDVVGSPAGRLRGKAAARGFYEHLFADLAQERVETLRRYYGKDFAVDESLWRGTAVGTPLGFVGGDRPLAFRILHLFDFADDGRIRRENVWMDTTAIASQLGGGPTSAKAIVAQFYADFDSGALSRYDAHPDFTATVFGTTVLDWPGFVSFGQSFLDAFPDGRHEFDFVVSEGDVVATMGHYRGRHTAGSLMGVPATGKHVDFTVMHIDRVCDGRIIEHRGIGDIDAMWAQLGVTPHAR